MRIDISRVVRCPEIDELVEADDCESCEHFQDIEGEELICKFKKKET